MPATLSFAMLASLDGYVTDSTGSFDWAAPDEEVHRFVNALQRGIGTYLYGRRMYEVMQVWERSDVAAGWPSYLQDYATIWRAADKVVYSTTLDTVATERTRIERTFDPAAVQRMKESSTRPISVAGPGLAAQAWKAGLVDECHLLLAPVVVGGGTRALPDDVRADLELLDHRRFTSGVVHLHHALRRSPAGA